MTKTWKLAGLLAACMILAVLGCKKDKTPPTVPSLTTTVATDVTTVSAKTGGTITGTGGDEITGAGVVYSKTNNMPTLSDLKVASTATTGTFEVDLTNLDPGSTYYIRAYATNSVGTGYGNVLTLMTGNAAPEATNVVINGTVEADLKVSAGYIYTDAENNPESGTSFQWYVADDIAGTGETAISGATDSTYTIDVNYEFKYLRVGVTPKSGEGTPEGVEVKSAFSQIAATTTMVHFTYNGQEVAYGIITSSVTGRQWMDRNLGAQQAATNMQDHLAYGDLFQWGRPADGHQLFNWTLDIGPGGGSGPDAGTSVNGMTTVQATSDVPGHSLFITPYDNNGYFLFYWKNTGNSNLWRAPDYANNPCPSGWHVPSNQEWADENLKADIYDGREIAAATNELKLTANGTRRNNNGIYPSVGWRLAYWTSDVYIDGTTPYSYAADIVKTNGVFNLNQDFEATLSYGMSNGLACRCIKNE